MTRTRFALALTLTLAVTTPSRAAFLQSVTPGSIATPHVLDVGTGPLLDAIIDRTQVLDFGPPGINNTAGVRASKLFVGQTLGISGTFDTLGGNPTGPLTLNRFASYPFLRNVGTIDPNLIGDLAGNNGYLTNRPIPAATTTALVGVGPVGLEQTIALGSGAISVLFGVPQAAFGFDVIGADGGSFSVTAYGADGVNLGSVSFPAITDQTLLFNLSTGAPELISGFSIVNTDPNGLGIGNIRYLANPAPPVPEPAGIALMGIGLGVALPVLWRRNRRIS